MRFLNDVSSISLLIQMKFRKLGNFCSAVSQSYPRSVYNDRDWRTHNYRRRRRR